MKRTNLTIFVAIILLAVATTASAQSWKDVLGGVLGKVTKDPTVSTAVDQLIGTSKVDAKSVVGTWNYSQPAVAFESENTLTKIGGVAASTKLETELAKKLEKVGIKKGKFSIKFEKDGNFTATVNGKSAKGKYTINGSTITFTKNDKSKTKINANVKLGTTLQITFKADKLLEFAKQFGSIAGNASTTLATISAIAKNYSGMQLGMRFTK